MKNFILLLLFATIGLASSCEKSESHSVTAKLTGIDYRKCASPFCGGWFIEIDGETKRFLEMPSNTDIELNGELEFPIPVEVQWEKYDNDWAEIQDLIKVDKLFKKD